MAFDPLIPAGNVAINATVIGIQENFAQIKTVFDVNHSALTGTGGDEGKHAKVILPQQIVDPDLLTYVGLFGKASTLGDTTALELFLKKGFEDAEPFDITSAGFGETGWCRLPSGILIKWRFDVSITAAVNIVGKTFVWPTGANIPVFEQIFWADAALRTRASGDTDQLDATLWLKSYSLTDLQVIYYTRSAFSTVVDQAIFPLRFSMIAIGV